MSPKRLSALSIEHALLGFLQNGPLHGYELHQRLQAAQTLGLVWHMKQPHLYALVARLEAEGLVTGELQPQDARPPKRVLHLTEAGRIAFTTWRETPVLHGRDLRIEFLAKLFWAQQAGAATVHTLITAQRTTCRAWQAELDREAADQPMDHPYPWLVMQFRHGQIAAMLHWLDTCETTLGHAVEAL